MDFNDFLSLPPYQVSKEKKENILLEKINMITNHHKLFCKEYDSFLKSFGVGKEAKSLEEVPYVPIGIFKQLELKSIKEEEIFKTMTSSGTSGQSVSKIYLDHETASWQQKVLCRIMSEYIGENRIPFLVVDSPQVLKNRDLFSARGAAILGFSMFASSITYALDDTMNPNWEEIERFIIENKDKKVLIFGFTFLLWENLIKKLKEKEYPLNLKNGIVLHGGGWKKLEEKAVSKEEYKSGAKMWLGTDRVYNYYGMAEQTGSIYMECEYGHLHASSYSDIIIRNKQTLEVANNREEGLVEVLSPFALSYPGHGILTEDLGVILGQDDCPCKRKGKYFKITGRVKRAEIRGCSDTHG